MPFEKLAKCNDEGDEAVTFPVHVQNLLQSNDRVGDEGNYGDIVHEILRVRYEANDDRQEFLEGAQDEVQVPNPEPGVSENAPAERDVRKGKQSDDVEKGPRDAVGVRVLFAK